MQPTELEDELCAWACARSHVVLRPEELAKVQELIVDTAACGIGGLSERASVVARSISTPAARDGVTVLGLTDRYSVAEAARHMSIASHVLELDDLVPSGSVHPGAVVIPAAIAAGDLLDAPGERLLKAIAVGYEIMVRLGEAVDPAVHYNDGFHPTATCGVFGAAAAVASLLGCNQKEFRSALGAAGTSVAGTLAYLNDGAATKPIQVGSAAANGVLAALVNHGGVSGSRTVFGGRYGFFHSYAPTANADALVRDLGQAPLRLMNSGIKPFACCRYIQPAVGLVIGLVRQHDLSPDDVEAIRVGVVAPATEIVGEPRARKIAPETTVDVQFSLPFSTAIAVSRRQLMPQDVVESLQMEAMRELARRVEVVHDPSLDEQYPAKWGGWVEITVQGGLTYRAVTAEPLGDPANPLSNDELQRKAAALAGADVAVALTAAAKALPTTSIREFISTIQESVT